MINGWIIAELRVGRQIGNYLNLIILAIISLKFFSLAQLNLKIYKLILFQNSKVYLKLLFGDHP